MNKIKAFTLIELLLALGIVGTIAALTAPRLMDNVNKKILTNQLKSVVNEVSFLLDEQLMNKSATVIGDTDFGDPVALRTHFESAQLCSDDKNTCWPEAYKKISGMTNADVEIPQNADSIRLKNGTVLYYTFGTTLPEWKLQWEKKKDLELKRITEYRKLIPSLALTLIPRGELDLKNLGEAKLWTGGTFIIDVNGKEGPNIVGRDYFEFTVSNLGKLPETAATLATLKTNCQNGNASSCFNYLMVNGWKMDY